MHRNIKLLYAFKAIKTFLLIMPIIVPFFQELGLSQTQIFLLESAWAGSILIFEVPSGYFADKFGRRLSMISGSILGTFTYSLYIMAEDFQMLLIANLIMGLSYSFISGADSAIAFDSFAVCKKELDYLKFESKSNGLSGFFQVIASLIGGALAIISLKIPVIGQILITGIAIPLSFLLTETPHLMKLTPLSVKEFANISLNTIFKRKELFLFISLSTIIGNMTHTIIWITQPLYQLIGIPLSYFGLLWSIQYLVYSCVSGFSYQIENFLGEKKTLIVFLIIGSLVYFIIGFFPNYLTLPLILILFAIRGAFKPIAANRINSLVTSKYRATISSIESLIRKLFYAIIGPLIGLATDKYSVVGGFISSGIIYGIFSLILIFKLLKYNPRNLPS